MIRSTADQSIKFSELGRKVFNICDKVWRGIYHLPSSVQFRTNWADPLCIEFNYPSYLATFDSDLLTRLVILCHDECIRLEIVPNMRYLKLRFHQRHGREGSVMHIHPTIEQAIAKLRCSSGQ